MDRAASVSRWATIRPIGVALAGLIAPALLSPAIAAPEVLQSLPGYWTLEADEDYLDSDDYVPPAPVRGLTLHGFAADDSISVEHGKIVVAADGSCPGPVTIVDDRMLPPDLPEQTQGEFWYFRSQDQALYLSRRWDYGVGENCTGTVTRVTRIVRVLWFNGQATFVEYDQQGEKDVSTEPIAEPGYYPIPRPLVRIAEDDLREALQKFRFRPRRDRVPGTGIKRICIDRSLSFFFSNTCYLDENGPWRGLVLSEFSQDDVGDAYSEYGTITVDPNALIDGRLFEWDRGLEWREPDGAPDATPGHAGP